MRSFILLCALLLFGSLSAQPLYNQYPYDYQNSGPYEGQLEEEFVILDPGDTLEGFWQNGVFYSGYTTYVFYDSGVSITAPPPLFSFDDPPPTPMPTFHYSQALQLGGIGFAWVGALMGGYGEGVATNQAGPRTQQGLHFRSRESHLYRTGGLYFAATGASLVVTGSVLYEIKLRRHQSGNDFWTSHKFWPTVGRNALWLTIGIGGSAALSEHGYRRAFRNP